uniref:HMG box domain-containing protein n=1 Tax=Aplanochytrium stocchinoi TaxID=215587 RepID=A0A7S3PSE9_9STRA|mmetsp:Transcript_18773/g.22908  ORF Transcript_18773/g.22908 Transcript_18773/m.22908 type:complete len:215 (+) Transcript_18773:197-841(+)
MATKTAKKSKKRKEEDREKQKGRQADVNSSMSLSEAEKAAKEKETKRQKKLKKKNDKKPKKAMTPFMVFSKETRKILVVENPKMTFSDIGRELGARWRSLDADRREEYVRKAQEDYNRFVVEKKNYVPPGEAGKKRRTAEELNKTKVKKSISAYLYFCNAHRNQVKAANPELKMVEVQRVLADKWMNSPRSLRLPFEKQAEADRFKFNSQGQNG